MPGIVGFITLDPNTDRNKNQLAAMLGSMLHEPFYEYGSCEWPEQGWYLGWTSHPDAFARCRPIANASGDTSLLFSGEHFDDSSSRHPRDKRTRLLSLYETKGEDFLEDINGWFAGALIDLRKKQLVLFNDRFGLHRIYYHETGECFAFASETKALLAVRPETRKLDERGVGEFLSVGATLQDRSLFPGIFCMPGGSAWMFNPSPIPSRRQYFTPWTWEDQTVLPRDVFYDKFHSTMSRVLPRYFYPAEDVGMSLTGGLDTRMVMAGRPAGVQLGACYTYGGIYRRCFDVQVSEEIAAAIGRPHQTLLLGDDFFSNFAEHAEESVWLTDGCLDVLGTHEVYFSRRARQLAPIRMTGNYGSEVLRSVSTFKYLPPSQTLFDAGVGGSLDEARQTFTEISAVHPVSFAAFKQIPWQLFGRLAAAQSQLTVRSPYMDNDVVSLMYQAPSELRRTKDISLRLIADLSPMLAGIRTDMGNGGKASSLTQFALKVHRYLLFKAEWYYGGGMPDFLTRFDHNPLARRLESLFVGSHKIEHYRLWFRDQLFDWVNAVMRDSRAAERPYLNRQSYCALLETHRKRAGNRMDEISKLITLELIQRSLLSGSNPRYGKRVVTQPNLQEKICL